MGTRHTPERPSTAFADIDLDGTGKPAGFVTMPHHSPDDDARGVMRPGNCCAAAAAPHEGDLP